MRVEVRPPAGRGAAPAPRQGGDSPGPHGLKIAASRREKRRLAAIFSSGDAGWIMSLARITGLTEKERWGGHIRRARDVGSCHNPSRFSPAPSWLLRGSLRNALGFPAFFKLPSRPVVSRRRGFGPSSKAPLATRAVLIEMKARIGSLKPVRGPSRPARPALSSPHGFFCNFLLPDSSKHSDLFQAASPPGAGGIASCPGRAGPLITEVRQQLVQASLSFCRT